MPRTKFFEECLSPAILRTAEEQLGETEEVKSRTLKELKTLLKSEADLYSCTDDWFLLRFLRVKKFNVERAFGMIKKYYKFKASYPDSIKMPSGVMDILEEGHFCFMEYRDDNNLAIPIFQIGQYDFDKYAIEDLFALCVTMFEICLMSEVFQICGYSAICDFSGFSLRHVRRFASPSIFYKIFTGLQDCVPARMKALHIVNEPLYCGIFIKFIRMFMSAKMRSRLHIHGSNLESLHEFFPPDILPDYLGGTQGPMTKCLEVLKKRVLLLEEHGTYLMRFGYEGKTLEKIRKWS